MIADPKPVSVNECESHPPSVGDAVASAPEIAINCWLGNSWGVPALRDWRAFSE
jgi:hypothetical protein